MKDEMEKSISIMTDKVNNHIDDFILKFSWSAKSWTSHWYFQGAPRSFVNLCKEASEARSADAGGPVKTKSERVVEDIAVADAIDVMTMKIVTIAIAQMEVMTMKIVTIATAKIEVVTMSMLKTIALKIKMRWLRRLCS